MECSIVLLSFLCHLELDFLITINRKYDTAGRDQRSKNDEVHLSETRAMAQGGRVAICLRSIVLSKYPGSARRGSNGSRILVQSHHGSLIIYL